MTFDQIRLFIPLRLELVTFNYNNISIRISSVKNVIYCSRNNTAV